MGTNESAGSPKRYTIRLIGLQPGAREEDLVAALKKLYPRNTPEQVQHLVTNLPSVLASSATEEVTRRVHAFLQPKGAVLKVTAVPAPPLVKERAPQGGAAEGQGPPAAAVEAAPEKAPASGADRRAKPRVHPGIQVHPMGVGEILDRSFRLLREHFWLFFLIIFIPQGAYFLVNHGGALLLGGAVGGQPAAGTSIGFGISAVLAFVVFIVIQFWAQGALIHAVSETYLGHGTSVKIAFGAVRRRLGRLLGTMMLAGVLVFLWPALAGMLAAIVMPFLAAVGIGGIILVLLGLIVGVGVLWLTIHLFLNWFLADKVLVLEDRAWMGALRRSKELMNARTEKGFWNRPKNKAGLILVVGFIIAGGIHLLFQLPGFAFNFLLPGLLTATLMGLLSIVSTSLATVYTATAMILFYYDIRLRKEGFDLKMMAQNLG